MAPGGKFGDYDVLRLLGKGGMGEVWLLSETATGTLVAAKILDSAAAASEESRIRFMNEAEAAMGMRHRNLVEVYDVGEDPETGQCYILMEYVSGGTLADKLQQNPGPMPVADAARVVKAMADVLELGRLQGFVHRDVKPANIMFSADGTPKLADLGIVLNRAVAGDDGDTTEITHANVMMGTPAYMSPEQMLDAHNVDTRADVYSLGIVFYEMLTGVRPNKGATFAQLMAKAVRCEVLPDVRTMRRDVPVSIAQLLAKMVDPNKDTRIATPGKISMTLAALDRGGFGAAAAAPAFVAQKHAAAKPASNASSASNVPRRNVGATSYRDRKAAERRENDKRSHVRSLAVCVVLLAFGFAAFFWISTQKPRRPERRDVASNGQGVHADGAYTCACADGKWAFRVRGGKAWLGDGDGPALRPLPSGKLVLPSSLEGVPVTGVEKRAFAQCADLAEVVVPAGCETIGDESFHSCGSLARVMLPSSVRTIGANAFFGTQVKVLDVNGIAEWNPAAIGGMVYLEDVRFAANNRAFAKHDGLVFSQDGTKLLFVPRNRTELLVPSTVERIEPYACEASSIRSLDLKGGVKTIGRSAFGGCGSLETVRLPTSLREMQPECFANCSRLHSVQFEGDAPVLAVGGSNVFGGTPSDLVLRVKRGSKGWNPKGGGLPATWPAGAGANARKIRYDE